MTELTLKEYTEQIAYHKQEIARLQKEFASVSAGGGGYISIFCGIITPTVFKSISWDDTIDSIKPMFNKIRLDTHTHTQYNKTSTSYGTRFNDLNNLRYGRYTWSQYKGNTTGRYDGHWETTNFLPGFYLQ